MPYRLYDRLRMTDSRMMILQLCCFFCKKSQNILSIQKKVVPLHAFSAFGLLSSAAEGTDDIHFGYANVEDSASRLTDVNH